MKGYAYPYDNKRSNTQERRRPYGACIGGDGLVVEDNTIYEMDLDCYECLQKQKENRA